MGLSGRKVKQRIAADPRNLTWADDASKFGATYLAKFGWSSSQGLGVTGEGRTSHIKVNQKLDMLGIGAAQSKDPNGIAWKQNKDFENLLKRLNADNTQPEESEMKDNADEEKEETKQDDEEEDKKSKKKRKREEEKDEKKKRRKKSVDVAEDEKAKSEGANMDPIEAPPSETSAAQFKTRTVSRPRAHRARHIAAKSFASKSAAAISEILGIASGPSSSASTAVTTPSGSLTPIESDENLEKLTTSTKSVADYFKERLLSKSSGRSTPAVSSMLNQSLLPVRDDDDDDSTPRIGLGASRTKIVDEDDEAPRGGLGSARITLEQTTSTSTSALATSKFASMFSSFAPATASKKDAPTEQLEEAKDEKATERDDSERKKKKRDGEKEKRKKDKKQKGAEIEKSDTPAEKQGDTSTSEKEKKRKRKEERRRAKEKAEESEMLDHDAGEQESREERKKRKKEKKQRES